MAKLYLVRHGQAAAAFDAATDPGLDTAGRAQAEAAAATLAPLGPLALLASPLRRTRETVAPFESRWHCSARIEPAVAEIPSPTADLTARGDWLRQFMTGTWDGAAPDLLRWRQGVGRALLALSEDTVVVSHFIAINVAVGLATDDARVVVFRPDNCSCTILDNADGRLRLLELGREAGTQVL